MNFLKENQKLVIAISILAIALAIIVSVAVITSRKNDTSDNNENLTPAENFANTRNAQRVSHLGQIHNSISQYIDEPDNSIEDFGDIETCGTGVSLIGTEYIDLDRILVDEYLVGIPRDPSSGTTEDTGYTICKTDDGGFKVAAPEAELGEEIFVSN